MSAAVTMRLQESVVPGHVQGPPIRPVTTPLPQFKQTTGSSPEKQAILLVGADPTTLHIYSGNLIGDAELERLEVLEAQNLSGAKAYFEEGRERIVAVVVDGGMADSDAIVEEIRGIERKAGSVNKSQRGVGILGVSTEELKGGEETRIEVDAFLRSPCESALFQNTVKRMISFTNHRRPQKQRE